MREDYSREDYNREHQCSREDYYMREDYIREVYCSREVVVDIASSSRGTREVTARSRG